MQLRQRVLALRGKSRRGEYVGKCSPKSEKVPAQVSKAEGKYLPAPAPVALPLPTESGIGVQCTTLSEKQIPVRRSTRIKLTRVLSFSL